MKQVSLTLWSVEVPLDVVDVDDSLSDPAKSIILKTAVFDSSSLAVELLSAFLSPSTTASVAAINLKYN